jgi:hypothetical protein
MRTTRKKGAGTGSSANRHEFSPKRDSRCAAAPPGNLRASQQRARERISSRPNFSILGFQLSQFLPFPMVFVADDVRRL